MDIGRKIKELRVEKNLTLQELSKASDVAIATLSRIENGKMTGTLDSHIKIAGALGVNLAQLYQDLDVSAPKEKIEIRTAHHAKELFVHNKNAIFEMLARYSFSKNMMPVLATLQKNASSPMEQSKAGAEKFVYVLTGTIMLEIGQQRHVLKKGDSAYFDSSIPHTCKNKSKALAQYLIVTSPSTL
jgi:transcriptional regulator with XRE-family HTH domain